MLWVSEKNVFQTIFVMLEEPDSSKIGYWFSLYMQVRVGARRARGVMGGGADELGEGSCERSIASVS